MKLRFPESEIKAIAERYSYGLDDVELMKLKPLVQRCGYLDKEQLLEVAKWKSTRSAGHVEENEADFIKEVTSWAFKTRNERARVESLTILDGVGWPTATVILHFFHRDPYPILDYRALSSLGLNEPNQYSFSFWWTYVLYCRELANRSGVDMRTLDKALWQFSKENS
ncbi:MAG: hypothetical protein AB7O38_03605 [Pirellulaceae bacterium]